MDPEEERVLYLTRVGREKIFKNGTYNVTSQRAITQDHPFYAKRDDEGSPDAQGPVADAQAAGPAPEVMQPDAQPEDTDALSSQIISSNFKVGLTQEEVDALLNGM